MMECRRCGDPSHDERTCSRLACPGLCPRCGSWTYIHRSGELACVSSFCSWAGPLPPQLNNDLVRQLDTGRKP